MKQSDLLRKQADMVDMAEKYEIYDWRDLVSVDNMFGVREQLRSIDWLYSFEQSKPKFALGVVEGKPVFEGDVLYCEGGSCKFQFGPIEGNWSWTPPKPKTVMIELLREDVEHWAGYLIYQSNLHAESVRLYNACHKALEEQK